MHWTIVCAAAGAARHDSNVTVNPHLRWVIFEFRPPKFAGSDLREERRLRFGCAISVNQRCIVCYDAIESRDVAVELGDTSLFISAEDLLSFRSAQVDRGACA